MRENPCGTGLFAFSCCLFPENRIVKKWKTVLFPQRWSVEFRENGGSFQGQKMAKRAVSGRDCAVRAGDFRDGAAAARADPASDREKIRGLERRAADLGL